MCRCGGREEDKNGGDEEEEGEEREVEREPIASQRMIYDERIRLSNGKARGKKTQSTEIKMKKERDKNEKTDDKTELLFCYSSLSRPGASEVGIDRPMFRSVFRSHRPPNTATYGLDLTNRPHLGRPES